MSAADSAPLTLLPGSPPIATQVKKCLNQFDVLLVDLETSDDYHTLKREVADAFGRFKIWSGNIGAHRVGQRSLDYRLRDASHLQEHVFTLLSSLLDGLQDGKWYPLGAIVLS